MDYSSLVRTQEGASMEEFFQMSMEERVAYFNASPDFHLDTIQDYHLIRLTVQEENNEVTYGRDKVNLLLYAEAELGLIYVVETEVAPKLVSSDKKYDEVRHTLGFKYFEGQKTTVGVFMNHEYKKAQAFIEQNYPKVDFELELDKILGLY